MIEIDVTAALVAHLTATLPESLDAFLVRAHDSDAPLDGPPAIIVHTKTASPRVRGSNLFDAEVVVSLRANPADTTLAEFENAWAWLTGAFYPATATIEALSNDDLHCYTLHAGMAETEITLDENERQRSFSMRGVFVGKNI